MHEAIILPEIFLDLKYPLGVLTYAYFTPVGRGALNSYLSIPPQVWKEFCNSVELKRYSYESKIGPIRYEPAFIYPEEKDLYNRELGYDFTCIARGKDYVYINPIGNVYGCVVLTGSDKTLGNIRENTLEEIWLNSKGWDFFGHTMSCEGCPALKYYNNLQPLEELTKVGLLPICPMTQYPKIEPWVYERNHY